MDVKLHTKLKHRIIGYYFAIFKSYFKAKNIHSLYYVDLYSGDGFCSCNKLDEDIDQYLPPNEQTHWEPAFFSLMKHADDTNFNLKCIFNDLEPDKISKLKDSINNKKYSKFVLDYGTEDANTYYKKALDKIEKSNRPSLFFLDPTNHKDLLFSTIREIANFKDPKTGRMPELIINLMTYSMLKNMQKMDKEKEQSISNALGSPEWIKKKDAYTGRTHELFLTIFLNNLEKFGYRTTYYEIKSTKTKSPIYYLIFATYRDDIYNLHKSMKSNIDTLINEEWVKNNYIIYSMIDAKAKGNRLLQEFTNNEEIVK